MEHEPHWQELDNDPEFLELFKAGWGLKIAEKIYGKDLVAEADKQSGKQLFGIGEVSESMQEIVDFIDKIEAEIKSAKTYMQTVEILRKTAEDNHIEITDEEIQKDKQASIDAMGF